MSGYDVAQICKNGHVIAKFARRHPQFTQKFCARCGQPTLMACPACNASIRGAFYSEYVFGAAHYDLPAFCIDCGAAFPWTENKLGVARELAAELPNLTSDEKNQLTESLGDLVMESPKTA